MTITRTIDIVNHDAPLSYMQDRALHSLVYDAYISYCESKSEQDALTSLPFATESAWVESMRKAVKNLRITKALIAEVRCSMTLLRTAIRNGWTLSEYANSMGFCVLVPIELPTEHSEPPVWLVEAIGRGR